MVTAGRTAADVGRMAALMIGMLVVWALVALEVAVVLGRGIRLADARACADRTLTTADLLAGFPPGVRSAHR